MEELLSLACLKTNPRYNIVETDTISDIYADGRLGATVNHESKYIECHYFIPQSLSGDGIDPTDYAAHALYKGIGALVAEGVNKGWRHNLPVS